MTPPVVNKPHTPIQPLQKNWDKLKYLLLARHILAVSVGTAMGLGYLFLGEGITTPGFSVVAGAIPALALEAITWFPAQAIRSTREAKKWGELARFKSGETGDQFNQLFAERDRLQAEINRLQVERTGQVSKIKRLGERETDLTADIKARDSELAPLRSGINGLKRNCRDLTVKAQRLEGDISSEKGKAQKQLEELDETKRQLKEVISDLDKASEALKSKTDEIDQLKEAQREVSSQLTQIQREQATKVSDLQKAERKITSLDEQKQQAETALQQVRGQLEQRAVLGADPQVIFKMQQLHKAMKTLLNTTRVRLIKRERARAVISTFLRGTSEQRDLLRQVLSLLQPEERARLSLKHVYGEGLAEMVNELDINTWPIKRLLSQLQEPKVVVGGKREILKVLQAKFSNFDYAEMKSLRRRLYPLFDLPEISDIVADLLSKLDQVQLSKAFADCPQLAVEDIATANLPVPCNRIGDAKQMIGEVVAAHPTLAQTGKIAGGVVGFLYGAASGDMLQAWLKFLDSPATTIEDKKFLLEKVVVGEVVFDHVSVIEEVRPLFQKLEKIDELHDLAKRALERVIPQTIKNKDVTLQTAGLKEGRAAVLVEELRQEQDELRSKLGIQAELESKLQDQAQLIERLSEELKVFLDEGEDLLSDLFSDRDFPALIVPVSRQIRSEVLHLPPRKKITPPIAGYELLQELGSGGGGEVMLAKKLSTHKLVVIKRVPPRVLEGLYGGDEQKREALMKDLNRFQSEAEILMKLCHPNLMKVFNYTINLDPNSNEVYYEGEFINGLNLSLLIHRKKRLSVYEALTILYFIVLGLEAAHEKGVIHRDLKPANIMITAFKRKAWVKVVDFGLAKDFSGGTGNTSLGTMGGTINYMAPENTTLGLKGLNHRADIYALALILYEMLTGRLPRKFEGDNRERMAQFVDWARNGEPTFSYEQLQQFPSVIHWLLSKMGAKKPEDRISFYREIRETIEQIMAKSVQFL